MEREEKAWASQVQWLVLCECEKRAHSVCLPMRIRDQKINIVWVCFASPVPVNVHSTKGAKISSFSISFSELSAPLSLPFSFSLLIELVRKRFPAYPPQISTSASTSGLHFAIWTLTNSAINSTSSLGILHIPHHLISLVYRWRDKRIREERSALFL